MIRLLSHLPLEKCQARLAQAVANHYGDIPLITGLVEPDGCFWLQIYHDADGATRRGNLTDRFEGQLKSAAELTKINGEFASHILSDKALCLFAIIFGLLAAGLAIMAIEAGEFVLASLPLAGFAFIGLQVRAHYRHINWRRQTVLYFLEEAAEAYQLDPTIVSATEIKDGK